VTDDSMDQPGQALVVIGSSAGGVDALSTLVTTLPVAFSAPIVLAQHLDPHRPSQLGEILSARTSLRVETVTDRSTLSPGTIYVIPPDRNANIVDQAIELVPDGEGPRPSIDHLFATAADAYGEGLVAVILTGLGSDGASGAVRVKEAGGTVIIQDPATAAFPSMPRSLPASIVDISVPIEQIGPLLTRVLATPEPSAPETDSALAELLGDLRARRGIDFSSYKVPTLLRRLNRRLVATGMADVASYRRYLQDNPNEERHLISSFLIKVTRFFRDAPLYDYLRAEILPELIAAAGDQRRELRVWSAGCATGEEPYSLAMLIAEAMGGTNRFGVRIFATDLDEDAIAFARRGIYSPATVANLDPELVDRYFTRRDGSYEIRKAIRSMVVFGHHDLGQRPPFPHVDLILCRNVLIYFTANLQQQALDAFAYSLRDGGYLVLGSSETPRPSDDLFRIRDRRQRVFQREGPRPALRPAWPVPALPSDESERWAPRTRSALSLALQQAEGDNQRAQLSGSRYETTLRQLPLGIALVDRRYDIAFINGAARRLLGIHGTAVGQDFIHLAQRIPSSPLRAAIDAVLRGESPARLERVVTTEPATGDVIHLTVSCQADQAGSNGTVTSVLIQVEDVTTVTRLEATVAETAERLRDENTAFEATIDRLTSANRELLAANRELSDSADELREQGEELRLGNAAAQVATEEIETLNEELQATNEELETLNEETQATLEELNATNDELTVRSLEMEDMAETHAAERSRLSAILASMGEAVVVVDSAGTVIRSNAAYDAVAASLDGDLFARDAAGEPLSPEASPLRRAGQGERFVAEFIAGTDTGSGQRWFETTGSPLVGDSRVGGVLVIRETTDRRLRRLEEQFLHIAGHELRSPLTALQGYLQLARRRTDGLDDERVSRYIDAAILQVQRQSQLISQLMEVGRLRTGKLALDFAPVDLVAILHEVVETMRVIAPERTFIVTSDIDLLVVQGDAIRLEQIVLNLLGNAVKHAPDSERIAIRLARNGGEALIEVHDDGPGIAQENRQVIFDLLTQVERTNHSDQSGLGLGLYIAREIAQAHGGSVSVQSEVGQGATFVVRLPISGPDAAAYP